MKSKAKLPFKEMHDIYGIRLYSKSLLENMIDPIPNAPLVGSLAVYDNLT